MRLCKYLDVMNLQKTQSALITAFNSRGLCTTVSIANECGMGQSTVYRALNGNPKRMSKALYKLCNYANIDTKNITSEPENCTILMTALKQVWDGSEAHAKRLAKLLIVANSCRM
jgi:DNA-binding phage protein